MNRLILSGVLSVFIAAVTLTSATLAQAKEQMAVKSVLSHSASAVDLRMDMRKLWEEHITYTRNFIISALGDLEDTEKVTDRLLRNQDDIGNALKPLYGYDAAKKLSTLLRGHIMIAADIVKAAKAGNNDGVTEGQKRWHENADEIATYLSVANPNWPKAALTDMLYKHLDYTTAEVVSRLKKDWSADIEAYDMGHDHMLAFADALTDGIVKQFPKTFSNR
jgi:hypothetical protein